MNDANEGLRALRRALARALAAVTVFAALALGSRALPGCSSAANAARVGAVATARVANRGGDAILDGVCVAECRAVGHLCHREAARCVRDTPARAATDAERTELARVRAAWAPVLEAHERVRVAHDALVASLAAGDSVQGGRYLEALANLARAYRALSATAGALGVALPPLPGEGSDAGTGADAAPGDAR